MRKHTSVTAQQLIDERGLMVQEQISTMKTVGKEYQKHYHNLTMGGVEKQLKYLTDRFTSVMERIHGLKYSVKTTRRNKKWKLVLEKSET